MVQPVTFTQPTLDYPFFKKPASTPISTPQKGWGAPDARSSPLLKESRTSPEDTPDLTKSSAEPSVIIEDVVGDEDEAPAPDKSGSSNVKSAHESSKQRELPPVKKVRTEDLEAHRPKVTQSGPMHHGMNGAGMRSLGRGPDYKQMQYLTFAPMSELEPGHIQEVLLQSTSTLTSVPSVSFRQAIPKLQDHLQ